MMQLDLPKTRQCDRISLKHSNVVVFYSYSPEDLLIKTVNSDFKIHNYRIERVWY